MNAASLHTASTKVLPVKDTTNPGNPPTTSEGRTVRQGGHLTRLSDPRLPLSVDELQDYKSVRSAIYFLRYRKKKASVRSVAAIFQSVKEGLRWQLISAYMQRFLIIESLKNQVGQQSGNSRATENKNYGNAFKHDGQQRVSSTAMRSAQKDASLSLTGNININNTSRARANTAPVDKTPEDDDEADDLADLAKSEVIARKYLALMRDRFPNTEIDQSPIQNEEE